MNDRAENACNPISHLSLFRRHIDEHKGGLQHAPYSAYKGKVMAYKTIFLLFGLLFCSLAWYLWISPFNWGFHFLFGDSSQLKNAASASCTLFAVIAFVLGVLHHPTDEMAHQFVKRSRKKLHKHYERKRRQLNYGRATSAADSQLIALKIQYEECLDAVAELKDEALLILKRVRISRALNDKEKERLYNEALYELDSKLQQIALS